MPVLQTLRYVHSAISRSRDWANLVFSVATMAAVAAACGELWMMRAQTPIEFGTAVRWTQIAVWVFILSVTGFVLLYLRAGRLWLGWTVCALGTFSLALNFLVGQNLGSTHWPLTASLFFVAIVVAMSYDMSREVFSAAQLAAELARSEAALRQSEWRYDQAAEAAGIGTWEWNVARNKIWATASARSLIGFAPGQRIDFKGVFAAIHPEDRDAEREAFKSCLETGKTYAREYRVLLPGGGVRWIATRCRIEVDAGGKPAVVRGVSFDVTERVQATEEIALQRSELAHLSRVSTLNELSVSIGHEINQPLQSILSNAQAALLLLAEESPNLVELREILKDIVVDDRRAGEVIRELRDLIKKGEGRSEALDADELVRGILRLLHSDMFDLLLILNRLRTLNEPE